MLELNSYVALFNQSGQLQPSYSRLSGLGIDLENLSNLSIENFIHQVLGKNSSGESPDSEILWKDFLAFKDYTKNQFNAMSELFPNECLILIDESLQPFRIKYAAVGEKDSIEYIWISLDRLQKSSAVDPEYERFQVIKKIPAEILVQCKNDIGKYLDDISEVMHAKQVDNLKAILHSLKGSFRVMELSSLANLTHDLESLIATEFTWENVRRSLDQIRRDWVLFESLITVFVVSDEQLQAHRKDEERKNLIQSFRNLKINLTDWWALVESKEFTDFEKSLNLFLLEPLLRIESTIKQDLRLIASKLGKGARVIFKIDPTIRFDRDQLNDVKALIMHLMTNSLTHGIQDPETRMEKGLNPEGTIKLTAARTQNFVTLIVEDDGQGFDRGKIIEKLLKRNLISTHQAGDQLSLDALMKLLIQEQISTAESLSQVSGRGVGLTSVKMIADKFNAELLCRTSIMGGACFQIVFPPTYLSK